MTLTEAEFLCQKRDVRNIFLGELEGYLSPSEAAKAPKVLVSVFNRPGMQANYYTNRVEILWALHDAGLLTIRRHGGAKLYYINNDRKASK